ncbi:MAG: ATP-binding protein [Anaerolineae bacterium]
MFSRMGLGDRLNLIVITLNVLILMMVAVLAYASSTSALRSQALNRFDQKSQQAFISMDAELVSLQAFTGEIASEIADFEAINVSSEVNNYLIDQLRAYDDIALVYSISVLRPEGTVVWVSPSRTNDALPQTRLRMVAADNILEVDHFAHAMTADDASWFVQDAAVFDTEAQPTITLAVPYQHATGNGLIWIDVLQTTFNDMLIDRLNANGLLFETLAGYVLILDETGTVIDSANVNHASSTLQTDVQRLNERLLVADREQNGLYRLLDPFNDDTPVLANVQQFTTNNWGFMALLPVSEIPILSADIYVPVVLVGVLGILLLFWAINRFIDNAVVRPLIDLGQSAAEIGEANLRFIILHQDKHDEIGRLARALDNMRTRLRETYDELANWSHTLEDRVIDRTEQLREARLDAEHNAQQLQVVYEGSLSVVNEAQLQPVLDKFIDRILVLLDASYCAIWLLDADRLQVQLVATNDTRRRKTIQPVTMSASRGIVGQAIRLDQPVIVNDYENYEHLVVLDAHYHDAGLPFQRGLSVPLKFAGSAIGAVVVGRKMSNVPFNLEAQRQLTLFTNMVSPSVRNAQLFTELQQAVNEARQANEVKTRFLASVTHELRTPLNLIINNTDFMRVGVFGDVNAEQVNRLNQTVRSAEHLLYLINDLLDVSKIEAGEMQLFIQKQEVYTLLEDAVDNAYALLESYDDKAEHITLRTEIEEDLPELPMDSRRIRQVLNNLLSNAIKFTEDGTVTLKVFCVEDGVHFSVHDTGMGIPQEEMAKLFSAFERTNAAKQNAIEGTGLGLPISRYLVQQHGSDLTVISQVNEGTTFAFTLPLDAQLTRGSLTDTQPITAILANSDE